MIAQADLLLISTALRCAADTRNTTLESDAWVAYGHHRHPGFVQATVGEQREAMERVRAFVMGPNKEAA